MRLTLGQYVPVDSWMHRLDPRTKMGLVAFFVAMLLSVQTWWGYGVGAVAVAVALAASKLSPGWVLRSLRPVLWFVVLSVALNSLWGEGRVLARVGPIQVTEQGLERAAMMGVRLVLLVAGASLLTLTTTPMELTDGLERLLAPGGRRLGLPAHEVAMMMTIALRFIPTLQEEAERILKAQLARGASFDRGGPVRRAASLLALLVPLFVSALRRADELAVAMEARGYRGGEGRSRLRQLRLRAADVAVLVGFGLVSGGVAVWL